MIKKRSSLDSEGSSFVSSASGKDLDEVEDKPPPIAKYQSSYKLPNMSNIKGHFDSEFN